MQKNCKNLVAALKRTDQKNLSIGSRKMTTVRSCLFPSFNLLRQIKYPYTYCLVTLILSVIMILCVITY